MVMLTSSCLPVTVTATTPPPAEPSTSVVSSSPWIRSISCCICCAIRCRLAIPIGLLLSSILGGQSAATDRRLLPRPVRPASADLADVGEIVGEDPAGLGDQVVRSGRREFDVGDDAADRHRMADDRGDPGLDPGRVGVRPTP